MKLDRRFLWNWKSAARNSQKCRKFKEHIDLNTEVICLLTDLMVSHQDELCPRAHYPIFACLESSTVLICLHKRPQGMPQPCISPKTCCTPGQTICLKATPPIPEAYHMLLLRHSLCWYPLPQRVLTTEFSHWQALSMRLLCTTDTHGELGDLTSATIAFQWPERPSTAQRIRPLHAKALSWLSEAEGNGRRMHCLKSRRGFKEASQHMHQGDHTSHLCGVHQAFLISYGAPVAV